MSASSSPMLLMSHSLVDSPRAGSGGEASTPHLTSIREIAVCLDGSELGSGIVPHAEVLARAFGARLTLLRVLETRSAGEPLDALEWGIRQREARSQLQRAEAALHELQGGSRSELLQGRAAEQICSWSARHGIDVTVLCSHGIRGVTEWDLASTARKLIDRAPGSLLLVPPAAAAGENVRYRRILVPLDGSPRAESVVPLALRIARSEQAELLLVHVVPAPELTRSGPLDAEGRELERRVLDYNQRAGNTYLDRVRARSDGAGAHARALVVSDGNVRSRLERLVRDERVDLVVMSAHGLTGRVDLPAGSVAEHALTHATTPVLVIRSGMRRPLRRVAPSSAGARESLVPSATAGS